MVTIDGIVQLPDLSLVLKGRATQDRQPLKELLFVTKEHGQLKKGKEERVSEENQQESVARSFFFTGTLLPGEENDWGSRGGQSSIGQPSLLCLFATQIRLNYDRFQGY